MTRALQWLCDLDHIHLGADQPLMLHWQPPLARWALVGLALVLLVFVVFAYRLESGGGARRALLALLRSATMLLVLAVLCQPVLVFQNNRVERARVLVLVDASSSMQQTDDYADAALAATMRAGATLTDAQELKRFSRLDLIRKALSAGEGAALRTLAAHNDVSLASFAAITTPLAGISAGDDLDAAVMAVNELTADGEATKLGTTLCQALEDPGAERLAAVVLFSDGQCTEPAGIAEALAAAGARRIPILTVPLGSPRRQCDVAVGSLVTDGSVFPGDLMSVRAELRVRGIGARCETTVRLYDEHDESLLAYKRIVLDDERRRTEIELTAQPRRAGRLPLRLVVAGLDGESDLDNNVARSEVAVLDDRLRVLYVEGYPRYEYRYLKNTLLREESVRLSCLLLSADEDFTQEGSEPIRRFPETPEELHEFDLVIFGDVDPRGDWLTDSQARMLVDFVSHQGGGFALIAGVRHAPHSFRGTALERLLPVRLEAEVWAADYSTVTQGFHPRLTVEGKLARLFRFHHLRAESEALFEALPPLYWMARAREPKPGAEVLLEHPTRHTARQPAPLVVQGRFGAGRTHYQATDDTWRWRRHTGEMVFDTYWVQVIRSLVQSRRLGEDRRVVILPDPPTARFGQPVTVRMKIFDTQLISMLSERTELSLRDRDGFVTQRLHLDTLGTDHHHIFEGSFVPRQSGTFVLQAEDIPPLPGAPPPRSALRIEHADAEARQPHADHELLRKLADGSGGRMIPLDRLAQALAGIEDRSLIIPDDISEPLWDTKLTLILFMTLLTAEWVTRKAYGMP